MTDILFATTCSSVECAALVGYANEKEPPNILVSYYYVNLFDAARDKNNIRYGDWVMDSGGFSAWKIGAAIDLKEYTRDAKRRLRDDPSLRFVFQLDKVGDWKTSQDYAQYMWDEGVPAVPIFHLGSPPKAIDWIKDHWKGRVSIGGAVGLSDSVRIPSMRAAVAAFWPREVHALGVASERVLDQIPFASADASSWFSSQRYGRWAAFGQQKLPLRGTIHKPLDVTAEIERMIRVEERLKAKWKAQLQQAKDNTQ